MGPLGSYMYVVGVVEADFFWVPELFQGCKRPFRAPQRVRNAGMWSAPGSRGGSQLRFRAVAVAFIVTGQI